MYPPINEVCSADTSVQSLLGDGDGALRLYPFGEAEQDEVRPYAVWQVIYGAPENYLGHVPDIDHYGTQIDVYAKTLSSAREVAEALRTALEPVGYVVGYNGEFREEITRDYRYSFTMDFYKNR